MKKYILVILASLMVIFAGCQPTDTKKNEEVGSPYMGGDKGVVTQFLKMGVFNEASNIEEIFAGEDFPIELDVKNIGEADVDIDKITIKLSGIDLSEANFEPKIPDTIKNKEMLEGISEFNKLGSQEQVTFGTFKYKGNLVGNVIDLSFLAKIDYLYQTRVTAPRICLKYDLKDESLCQVSESKQVFSSAAPIQAKSAIESSAGIGKVAVEFEIQNVGSGRVTTSDRDFDYRYNQLSFTVVSTTPDMWECKATSGGSTNIVRLDTTTGKATINCKLKNALNKDDLKLDQLSLILDYKYRETIDKQLRVKKEN